MTETYRNDGSPAIWFGLGELENGLSAYCNYGGGREWVDSPENFVEILGNVGADLTAEIIAAYYDGRMQDAGDNVADAGLPLTVERDETGGETEFDFWRTE